MHLQRQIKGVLNTILCAQNGGYEVAPIQYSRAKYFRALLRLLPHRVESEKVLNREGLPVGLGPGAGVDCEEYHSLVEGVGPDAHFYTDETAPWLSAANCSAYLAKLDLFVEEMHTDCLNRSERTLGGTYRDYVEQNLPDEVGGRVHLALHGMTHAAAVATVHQAAGRGVCTTRRTSTGLEVTKVCK